MAAQAELVHLKNDEPLEHVLEVLDADGAVIVEECFSDEVINQILAELMPYAEKPDSNRTYISPTIAAFFGDHTRHVTGLASKSPTFVAEVLLHPLMLDIADAVLGPNCADIQVNVAHMLVVGPGAQAQFPHRDEDVWVHMPQPSPEMELSSVTALCDFTKELGATRVVPGSHRWEPDRQPEPHEFANAEMPSGSRVIYLGSTIHGAGTNSTTDQHRPAFHLSYMLGWLRSEENNCLATPPDVARAGARRGGRGRGRGGGGGG
ncbi:MAG: mitomycin antibiotic biosynthesis protein, partial [Acidimicrobiia bacterium]|nr:mitomycin antibiotic biosynthesis protein [Acidimicrobiia bacterium]